jgi:DNA-binding IclR family transcriptional regulator
LGRALERVRDRGYATEDREYRSESRAVALPVGGADAEVVAALAVSTKGPLRELLGRVDLVGETAGVLSRRLLEDAR